MTEEQYYKMRSQLWTVGCVVLIVATIEMVVFHSMAVAKMESTAAKIESMRCSCSRQNIRTGDNNLSVQQRADPAEQLAREMLQSQGKIDK